jgi:hypothetical protein
MGRSGPTCGSWDSAGVSWLRGAGSRRSRPRWLGSRPKPNGGRRVSWDAGAPAPAIRPQPSADSPPPSRRRRSTTGCALTRAHMALWLGGNGRAQAPVHRTAATDPGGQGHRPTIEARPGKAYRSSDSGATAHRASGRILVAADESRERCQACGDRGGSRRATARTCRMSPGPGLPHSTSDARSSST